MTAMAIEPYKALIVALLEQAIRDTHHRHFEVRQIAYSWLYHDRCCTDLCEMIGLNLKALTKALDRDLVSTSTLRLR